MFYTSPVRSNPYNFKIFYLLNVVKCMYLGLKFKKQWNISNPPTLLCFSWKNLALFRIFQVVRTIHVPQYRIMNIIHYKYFNISLYGTEELTGPKNCSFLIFYYCIIYFVYWSNYPNASYLEYGNTFSHKCDQILLLTLQCFTCGNEKNTYIVNNIFNNGQYPRSFQPSRLAQKPRAPSIGKFENSSMLYSSGY
jgi:hypothetical protein